LVRLLILGAGSMAQRHAAAFATVAGCEVAAVVEPNAERLAGFLACHDVPKGFADLDSAIRWGGFDAAANATPDAAHYATTMNLVAAGKHVFCEKPLATDHPSARRMAEAAEARGLINMVNFTYRNCPALHQARHIAVSGEIGEVRHFEAHYLQSWLVGRHRGDWRSDERWLWRLSSAHGSKGALGDIGTHIVDFTTYATGSDIVSVTGRIGVFPKAPNDRIGDYMLDANDSFVMSAELANRALGVIHATR
jgi:predicted dehydrogenase